MLKLHGYAQVIITTVHFINIKGFTECVFFPLGACHLKASILFLVPHFHGYRGLPPESTASEGDICVDTGAFPLFQECPNGMEEQRAP